MRFFFHYALRAGNALELGAGTDRVALAIAGQHIPVWAVEPSPVMRAACLVKAAQQHAGSLAAYAIAHMWYTNHTSDEFTKNEL